MTDTNRDSNIITARLVPDARRADLAGRLFGFGFPFTLEPAIYGFASRLSGDYRGGHWHFHTLSNGGFYMAPEGEGFHVICENGFEGVLSADAFGITVCGYAYGNLSFRVDAFAEVCAEHYHRLRAFALVHVDSGQILAAWD